MLTARQASKELHVTKYAVLEAIRKKRIIARKVNHKWTITEEDLSNYLNTKWSRSNHMFNGELLHDNKKGEITVKEVANLVGCPAQKVYHALRVNKIKGFKKKYFWVINLEDVKEFKTFVKNEKIKKEKANVLRDKRNSERLRKAPKQEISMLRRISSQ